MRNCMRYVVVLAILIGVSWQVCADRVIGLNFGDGSSTPNLAGETADGLSNWTDTAGNDGTGVVVLGSNDLVACDWHCANTWAGGQENTSEQQLYRVYLDDSNNEITITISGLSAWMASENLDVYTLRIYHSTDNSNMTFEDVTIMSEGSVLETVQETNAWSTDGGTRAYADSGALTADTITIEPADRTDNTRGCIAGVKIVGVDKFAAINPSPAVGVEVPVNLTEISFEQDSDVSGMGAAYDIYFGTDPNELSPTYYGLTPVKTTSDDPADFFYQPGVLDNSETYYWRVDALEPNLPSSVIVHTGDEWWFTTQPASPRIEVDPVSMTVAIGTAEVVFSVEGINIDSYQWYKDGAVIPGEMNSTLTIYDVQVEDEGFYYCMGDNSLNDPAVSGSAQLMTERLAGWWKMDGDLTDSVAAAVAGAVAHDGFSVDPNFAAGKDNGAIEFYGDLDGLVTVQDSADFFNFYPLGYTISVWVQNTQASGWAAYVAKQQRPEEPWKGFIVSQAAGQPIHALRQSGDGDGLYSGEQIADGDWHLVTASYDPAAQESKIYVDGALKNTLTVTGTPEVNPMPLIFGEEVSEGTVSPYTGLLDDIRIYSYPLDQITVAKMYVDFNPGEEICIANPAFDVAGPDGIGDEFRDCKVNLYDFAAIAGEWLECNLVPTCIQ